MSDQPQGPGWWQASDYKWYPPQPPTPPPTAPPPAPYGTAPQYGAPPQSGMPPYAAPPSYPGAVNITVKKKSNLPWILGVIAIVLLLGAGGCVALVVTAADNVADEVNENEARPVVPGSDDSSSVESGGTGGAGTREAPLPLGTEVDLGNGWRVTVVSADVGPGAATAVAQANEFNQPADDGTRYIVVNLSATFAGRPDAPTEAPFVGLTTSVFGSDNVERNTYDAFASGPEPTFDTLAELAAGGTASGSVVIQVGASETGLVMRIEPAMSFDSTETWIALE